MTLDPLFDSWVSSLKLSPASVRSYMAMWHTWTCFLGEQHLTPADGTLGLLSAFLAQQGRMETRRRYLALIDRVYRYALLESKIDKNPAEGVKLPVRMASERPVPVILNRGQEQAFLQALPVPTHPDDWKRARDAALLVLILASGLSPGEAIQVTQLDLDLTPRTRTPFVRTAGTGRREREAPVAAFAWDLLNTWVFQRGFLPVSGDLLFPAAYDGSTLSPSTVWRLMQRVLKAAGIEKPHQGASVLRHTFATRQVAHDRPVPIVQDWLGLYRASSAAAYVKLAGKDVAPV